MELIDIPPGYWTITPAGFAARVIATAAQLDQMRGDLLRGAGGVLDGHRGDLERDLALSDAADPNMRAAAAGEYNITAHEQTGQMLSRFGPGDDLAINTDRATPPDQLANPGFPYARDPGVDPPKDEHGNDVPIDIDQQSTAARAPAPAPAAAAPGAGTAAAPAAAPPAPGLPTYDQVNNAYYQDLGHGATVDDYQTYWAARADWREAIYNSDEARAFRDQQRQAATPPADSFVSPDQMAAALSQVDLTIHVMV